MTDNISVTTYSLFDAIHSRYQPVAPPSPVPIFRYEQEVHNLLQFGLRNPTHRATASPAFPLNGSFRAQARYRQARHQQAEQSEYHRSVASTHNSRVVSRSLRHSAITRNYQDASPCAPLPQEWRSDTPPNGGYYAPRAIFPPRLAPAPMLLDRCIRPGLATQLATLHALEGTSRNPALRDIRYIDIWAAGSEPNRSLISIDAVHLDNFVHDIQFAEVSSWYMLVIRLCYDDEFPIGISADTYERLRLREESFGTVGGDHVATFAQKHHVAMAWPVETTTSTEIVAATQVQKWIVMTCGRQGAMPVMDIYTGEDEPDEMSVYTLRLKRQCWEMVVEAFGNGGLVIQVGTESNEANGSNSHGERA